LTRAWPLHGLLAWAGLVAGPAPAQERAGDGAAAFRRAVAGARDALARDEGGLWGVRLDTLRWLAVSATRAYATDDPGLESFAFEGGLWAGPPPAGVAPANTLLLWVGRRWAMVALPLPEDSLEAVRLLLHEAWHVVQSGVVVSDAPNEAGVTGDDLLDGPDGRLWLQLEWRALARALEAEGAARDRALLAALVFRARRYAAASPEERRRERLLDVHEGVAEYTAWRLTGSDPLRLAARLRAEAPRRRSYVRSFAYYTGPAYGLLLDARSPGWTHRFRTSPNLQLAALATLRAPPGWLSEWLEGTCCEGLDELRSLARREGRLHGHDSLRRSELARWRDHLALLELARKRFLQGPTLRLRPGPLNIVFDPAGQLPLGEAGTVMSGLHWGSADGAELLAPRGALVTRDWQELIVPLGRVAPREGTLEAPITLEGEGWTLRLPALWRLSRDGESWVVGPPVP
jgi:hypothetical protein